MEPPTPHIDAKKGDFAKTVLMPGDPLRAKLIAEKYLKNAVLVNNVRGVQGYTGEYNGKRVSVMASGMGVSSIAIYSTELYLAYGVENIIRVGSIGGINEASHCKDIIVATGACTNSAYGSQFGLNGTVSAVASFDLLKRVEEAAKKLNKNERLKYGLVMSTDTFYTYKPGMDPEWARVGCLGVEMEAYALYVNAQRFGKKAVAICTVSDDLIRNERLDANERLVGFDEMIKIALEAAEA